MDANEKIGIIGVIVAVAAVVVPIAVGQWNRAKDRSVKVKAKIGPHIVLGVDGKPLHYGIAVEVLSVGNEPAEVNLVAIRLAGVDVSESMIGGFSGTQPSNKPIGLDPMLSGIEVTLRLLTNDRQYPVADAEHSTAKIERKHSAHFFTPLPFQSGIQNLFDNAYDDQLFVVADILPEKKKVVLKGREVADMLREALFAHRGRPVDSTFVHNFNVFTVSTRQADDWALGKYNDKGFAIKDKLAPSLHSQRDKADQEKRRHAEKYGDVWSSAWRCHALDGLVLPVREIMVVPRGRGGEFHPREARLPTVKARAITEALRRLMSEAMSKDAEFSAVLGGNGKGAEIAVNFSHIGKAAILAFTSPTSGGDFHIHGVLALLRKQSAVDDARTMELVRQYACLKEIPPTSFQMALAETQPVAAMYFADIGSANFPELFVAIRFCAAAYFIC